MIVQVLAKYMMLRYLDPQGSGFRTSRLGFRILGASCVESQGRRGEELGKFRQGSGIRT